MNFAEWEPVYRSILEDFGYDRRADEASRDRLAAITHPVDLSVFAEIRGATVGVAGAAPSLHDEFGRLDTVDLVFAASAAAEVLSAADISVDCMVTDLDKTPDTAVRLTEAGTPVVVLAHGDNIDLVEEWVPRCALDWIVATTQAEPRGHVHNFGGFTDGDRAAFLVDAFGAASLVFAGWSFDDPSVDQEKRRKLAWAERLLYWLEIRRGDRFAVLDGRRAAIETRHLPV